MDRRRKNFRIAAASRCLCILHCDRRTATQETTPCSHHLHKRATMKHRRDNAKMGVAMKFSFSMRNLVTPPWSIHNLRRVYAYKLNYPSPRISMLIRGASIFFIAARPHQTTLRLGVWGIVAWIMKSEDMKWPWGAPAIDEHGRPERLPRDICYSTQELTQLGS